MNSTVYLDNSATTKPSALAVEYINKALTECWGNPSSLHSKGMEAEHIVEECRVEIANLLSSKPEEIFFTSGGTEANNTAVFGAVKALHRRGKRIVTTATEHSSVFEACKRLEVLGFDVVYIKPEADGNILSEKIVEAVTADTILISIMLVNNETGCIYPVSAAREAVKAVSSPALIHCDCVQAFGKLDINADKLSADLITLSSHKIKGPKGIGVLYKKKGVRLLPTVYGGEQQSSFRPGTEAVPLIAGLLGAVKGLSIKANFEKVQALNYYARKALKSIDGIVFNSPENALPYILNVSFPGYRSETILHFLDSKGIFVSSGSACAKGLPSHVLSSMGLKSLIADSAIRLSFSDENTIEDIDRFIEAVKEAQKQLIKSKR